MATKTDEEILGKWIKIYTEELDDIENSALRLYKTALEEGKDNAQADAIIKAISEKEMIAPDFLVKIVQRAEEKARADEHRKCEKECTQYDKGYNAGMATEAELWKPKMKEAYAKGQSDKQKELLGSKNTYDIGFQAGISAVEKELKKRGWERKQINEEDGYVPADEMIDIIEEAISAARKVKP